MPYGIINGPSVFSRLMTIVLESLDHFAISYLDDILVFSETEQEHLNHIQQVFDRLREHKLKLKLTKCSFMQAETQYLGHIVNESGISPDPEKVEAIRSMSAPTSVREVRGFIGMCSWYRRFIPNFSSIARPLIDLTKKYARFNWTDACQSAFDFLKESLTAVSNLAHVDLHKPYILYTDASHDCIGACLVQLADNDEMDPREGKNEKPIHFLSHILSPTQTRWSTIEKECYAIYYSLQKLDHYLHNAEVTIRTDHQPLKCPSGFAHDQ